MGQGEFVSFCYECSIVAALDYIKQDRWGIMENQKNNRQDEDQQKKDA